MRPTNTATQIPVTVTARRQRAGTAGSNTSSDTPTMIVTVVAWPLGKLYPPAPATGSGTTGRSRPTSTFNVGLSAAPPIAVTAT